MEYTKNYHLPQWAEEDRILMADFNAMCGAIESGLTGHQGTMAALAASMGNGGKTCRVAFGSYTGTGTFGAANPNVLTFDFCPVLVLVGSEKNASGGVWPAFLMRGCPVSGNDYMANQLLHVTWGDNSVSWYNDSHGEHQCNAPSQPYHYVVLGYDLNS